MNGLGRRDFLKKCGIGAGAIMASNFFSDKLIAGEIPQQGVNILDSRFGLSNEDIRKILSVALSKGGDFSELFFEYRMSNSITMEEDIIKSSSESISLGVGIRVLNERQTGYGFTNELTFESIKNAALSAAAIASGGSKLKIADFTVQKPKHQIYETNKLLFDEKINTKIDLVKASYDAAKNYDSRITKVQASIADDIQYVTIINSEGLVAHDVRPSSRIFVISTAEEKGNRNTGIGNAGGRVGMEYYIKEKTPKYIGEKASKEAIILLSAKDAPAGEMPVVLSRDQSGVMIHEAVGHPLEADANWKKASIMWDKMGQMVANPIVTIYDDATIPKYRGSLNIDDEGTQTENAMLIEKGKLVGYLNDRLSAKILGHKQNGHGRRESYKYPPIPRMNNTILGRGDHDPEEIIKSVKKGFYAVTYQGGQVSDTGKFTFSVNMGYLIEDGKLTQPLKNATLIGTNVQILKEVSMIGNDMDFFLGTCGKGGQSAAVTAGTPTLKINKMTVGGIA
jgi:TldD protein